MDIQTTKLKLMQQLLDTQKEQVLLRIKEIFDQENEVDFWDELSEEDQSAINEGLDQLDKGEHVSHQSVKDQIKNRLNL